MKENNIIFSFKGAISQDLLVEIANQIKHQFNMDKKYKKLFAIFVELAQNIMFYSDERENNGQSDNGVGIILLSEEDEFYTLTSGNLILNSKVPGLKTNIDYIKSKSSDELKELYNAKIRADRVEGSKGAGLGFIDISRKSDNNIDYSFDYFDENYSFFNYIVNIKKV